MRKLSLLSLCIVITVALLGITASQAARKETLRITCWEGYADAAIVKEYKALVKAKYGIDVDVQTHYPTDQDEFYQAAKNGTADLISPPADLAKTPRFNCFQQGNFLLSEVDLKNIPNAQKMIPFFQADQSLIHKGKRYGVPYNCGPYGLDYNTEMVQEPPQSWNVLWDPQYKGKYTINNNFCKCNIWITALSLGYRYDQIFDIEKLDRQKVQERLNVLAQNAYSFWDGSAKPEEFPKLALATDWGFAAAQANQKGGKWMVAAPKEGGTAWIDYWCITKAAAKGTKKKLCEEWINLQLSPKAQAAVVKKQGVSPVVNLAEGLVTPTERTLFHVGDNDYFKTVAIWQVMSEKTEKAYAEMWETAKATRKK
ncbi:extracellular solute-binding protein [Geomonas sp. RF6]|uniref:ABC transporter substrate-binding protein n=1 Tax=Geomonas sp. RF6 TaxID=2897342 RepID=UPI001E2D8A90|nr:extracellular solute-binding protein [Geomonas sp. RF6]UFS70940.1 extracellular solute-binding protein [Geomonas sp. RF6]